MNDRVITSAMLVAVMKYGQSYLSHGIAKTFGIPSPEMRQLLNVAAEEGVIETRTHNGIHLYMLVGEAPPPPEMKPLKISREMRAAMDRCKELRVHESHFGEPKPELDL